MNATTLAVPPQQLLERLRDAGDNPVVPEADRPQALGWLRCVLVDFTALNTHITLLQQLHGDAPFRLPSARRDGAAPPTPTSPDPRFRFSDVWPNERIVPILDGGVDVLKNDELGQLLLNPYALADLQDVISEVSSDTWLPVIQDVGREMMRRDGVRHKKVPPPGRLLPGELLSDQAGSRAKPWRWAALSSLATAAVLLIAFLAVLQSLTRRGDSDSNLVASATPKYGKRGGSERILTGLEVTSNFDGHVTVIFFEPKNKQIVLPTPGSDQDWRVTGGGPPTAVVLPDSVVDATAALVVVTETPADAPIRKMLDKRYTADQIDEVRSLLQTKLRDLNFKRFSINPILIATAKAP